MNEDSLPSDAALPADAVIRVTMKAFEYAPDFQFLENSVANECETAAEPSVDETAVINGEAIEHRKRQAPG